MAEMKAEIKCEDLDRRAGSRRAGKIRTSKKDHPEDADRRASLKTRAEDHSRRP